MKTVERNKVASRFSDKLKSTTECQEPKRLSKLGQWMRDNPGGIITVLDRRAVNR